VAVTRLGNFVRIGTAAAAIAGHIADVRELG
jgi:hypothetical protein